MIELIKLRVYKKLLNKSKYKETEFYQPHLFLYQIHVACVNQNPKKKQDKKFHAAHHPRIHGITLPAKY